MSKALLITASVIIFAACEGNLTGVQQTLSAGGLMAEYIESKAAARSKYDGKPIRVEGYVLAEARIPKLDESEGLILLGEQEGRGLLQVSCWFTRKEIETLSRIARGNYVTVDGVLNGERGTELRFCRLVRDDGPQAQSISRP